MKKKALVRQEAIRQLREMDEDALKNRIIIPLFLRSGWQCFDVDRRGEIQHKLDVLLKLPREHHEIFEGIQLKTE